MYNVYRKLFLYFSTTCKNKLILSFYKISNQVISELLFNSNLRQRVSLGKQSPVTVSSTHNKWN